ncbi:MAG: DMT family transporter [Chitinophagaceae bacterium]|jgi:drug/metabolite transporter (DMT)-like permease
MAIFDFNTLIIQTSADTLKKIAKYNPFTLHKKGTRPKAIWALVAVCILWGTTWVASKEGVRYLPPLQLAGLRQLSAGILYMGFFLFMRAPLPKGKEWRPILLLSLLNFILSNGLSTWGVKFISAGLAAIMGAIFPLWLVIIGLFSTKEKMPNKAIIGLLLGFSGVCIIFYDHLHDFLQPNFRFGILLSLLATWSWAFATLYTKKQAANFNPYFSLGIQMVISGTILTVGTNWTGIAVPIFTMPWQSWAVIAYLVLMGSVFSFIFYLYALQHLPTELASIYAYINPIVALFMGSVFFQEKITIFILIGGAVALLGVWMVNKAFRNATAFEQPEPEGM